jgi:AAA ATPase domain/Protein of unknown function (DUF4435)
MKMKLDSATIENFRGIKRVELKELRNTIILAGTNGSGKSSVFDAIRLLKSVYGGYQPNEWHHWMGEFQIQFNQADSSLDAILNDKTRPMNIECRFRLHSNELEYLRQNAEALVRESVWRVVAPELSGWKSLGSAPMAAQLRAHTTEVNDLVSEQLPGLESELALGLINTQITISAGKPLYILPSKVMELIFSTYLPGQIGLIDYHGPQRFFQRETLQGLNLNLEALQQQQRQSALYNYANKYTNVKTELASSFVQEMLAERAGTHQTAQSTLSNTLKELFQTFFPDKTFEGPVPNQNGRLEFPVRMSDGSSHDLNELSAGEKEVLYGYLRIRNSAPRYSIILLDEPELHLNPRLIRKLPKFYNEHLGRALDNQIWLVTHSDALLREAVGDQAFSIYHMIPSPSTEFATNQAKVLLPGEDVERAVLDLVGDLAAYRPGGKVVIFEGGGETEFDMEMTYLLFPDLADKTNGISGGNKSRVRSLHEILDAAASSAKIPMKIFSIVDRDTDSGISTSAARLQWDSYHIENYLLDAGFILDVLRSLGLSSLSTKEDVENALRECARKAIAAVVRSQLTRFVNDALVSSIGLGIDPKSERISALLSDALQSAVRKINKVAQELDNEELQSKERELSDQFNADLVSGNWKNSLPGRSILRGFVGQHVQTISYIPFRNLILNRMADARFQPPGMAHVIAQITSA